MATTAASLGATLNLKKPLYLQPQFPLNPHFRSSFVHFKIQTSSRCLGVKCFVTTHTNNPTTTYYKSGKNHASMDEIAFVIEMKNEKNSLVEFVSCSILDSIRVLCKPAAAAVLMGFLFLIYFSPDCAFAASGGRMGGRSFPSRSSSSRSSSSSSRSYGSSSSSSSSRSYSSSSPSKSSSSSWNWGSSSGSTPRSSSSSSWNWGSSSDSYPRSSSSSSSSWNWNWNSNSNSSPSKSSSHVNAVPKTEAVSSTPIKKNEPSKDAVELSSSTVTLENKTVSQITPAPKGNEFHPFVILSVGVFCGAVGLLVTQYLNQGFESDVYAGSSTVLKLQVGLFGSAKSLQQELNKIAETADTSTSKGQSHVLNETVVALLRHSDYFMSSYLSVDVKRSMDKCEEKFNELSVEERGKLDEETLVNVNNVKKKSSKTFTSDGSGDKYIVVTILVAARGGVELPSLNNSSDLKKGLQKVASIPSDKILAVEVLWTPQNEDDTLSEQELMNNYPSLRPLFSEG